MGERGTCAVASEELRNGHEYAGARSQSCEVRDPVVSVASQCLLKRGKRKVVRMEMAYSPINISIILSTCSVIGVQLDAGEDPLAPVNRADKTNGAVHATGNVDNIADD